jgi:DNA-binding CsgD family transcriptional regulator
MPSTGINLDLLEQIIAAPAEQKMAEAALTVFQTLLPGEYHSAIIIHPGTSTCDILYPDAGWLPRTHPMIETVAKTHARHPLMAKFYADGTPGVFSRSQLVPDQVWRRSEIYNEAERHLGFADGSALCQTTVTGNVLALTCGRAKNFPAKDLEPAQAFQRILKVLPPFHNAAATVLADGRAIGSFQNLTRREHEILHWVREGKRNAEIAIILGISPHTVRHHLEKIFPKIGVETRTAAARLPLR